MNPITLIDGYKVDHRRQYPGGTRFVYSNWTPRGSRIPGTTHVVNFGLQYFLQRYLNEEMERFFLNPRNIALNKYERRIAGYLGPDAATTIGTDHIAQLWDLQHIPLRFYALPEGARVPLRVPPILVENTRPEFFWLVNYFETLMSNVLWLPLTSATTAYGYRRLLDDWAAQTGADPSFVQWQGHDFSFRGLPGVEAAMLSGAAHLLSFTGTDTIPALDLIEGYYGDELPENYLIGGSVPATEHSVMCAGGEAGEQETFRRILDLYPSGIVSVVSDTWDLWQVLTCYLPALREQICARNGKLVIRPDSGDPVKIVCGDDAAPEGSPQQKGVVQLLWESFPGGSFNDKGYKVLDPHVGVIYGDAITRERAEAICAGLARNGFCTSAIVFGIGSYTYQYVTRDTYGLAMKATWCQIDNEPRNIFKKPRTDSGEKFSAKGRLAILPGDEPDDLVLVHEATPGEERRSLAQPVWENGMFLRRENFQQIRQRLHPGKF